jgi:outer membrane protein OmpA-like peptidoglycan-associated protein
MRSLLLLAFLLVTCIASTPAKESKNLVRANFYYSHFAYNEAIPYFEKVADSLKDPIVFGHLGDCYRATGNLEKAADLYGKAVREQGYTQATSLKYGQVLMQLMRYREAERWLNEYLKSNPGDRRAANLVAGCKAAPTLLSATSAGTARPLEINTDGSEFAPTMWKGRLVYMSDTVIGVKKQTDRWTGNAYYNIYSVTCDSNGHTDHDLDKVAKAKEINIKYHTGPCTFSGDGRQMYFTRSRFNDNFLRKKAVTNKDSIVVLEIMIASDYDEQEKKFKNIEPFQYNNKSYSVAHAAISPNGKQLVFSSTMPNGSGGSDLYICSMNGGAWSEPQNLGTTINTEGEEVFSYWANDSVLYFSSDGLAGIGGLDIYRTSWNRQQLQFSTPENVGAPLNSSYDDVSLAMHGQDDNAYFSSNRPAAKKGDNLYFYKKNQLFLKVIVTDSLTGKPLSRAILSLATAENNREAASNDAGLWATRVTPATYMLDVSKDGYNSKQLAINAVYDEATDTITRTVVLGSPIKETEAIPPIVPLPPVSFTKVVGIPELNQIYEIGHFYFAFDKSDLNDTAKYVLDSLVSYLELRPTMRIQVRAHTDCRGGDAYNLKLSKERALAVVKYLTEKGIARKRLEYEGFGMRKPKVPCPVCDQCSDEQHYLNRVLEFKVLQL